MQLTQINHCDGVLSNYWNILLWKKISQRTVILSLQWTKLSGENGKKVHFYQSIIPLPLYQCWIISILFDFNFEHLWGCHLCYNYQFSPLIVFKIVVKPLVQVKIIGITHLLRTTRCCCWRDWNLNSVFSERFLKLIFFYYYTRF